MQISLSIDFKHTVHGSKNIAFRCRTYIRDESERPDATRTVFDGLVLKCVERYEFENYTQQRKWLQNCRIKFWASFPERFGNISVLRKNGFLVFFHIFLHITKDSLNNIEIWLFCKKNQRHKTFQNHFQLSLLNII